MLPISLLGLIIFLVSAIFFFWLFKTKVLIRHRYVYSKSDSEIIAVIHENAKAAEEGNLKRYMATMHLDSPAYSATRQLAEQMFIAFDLAYQVEGAKVLKNSGQEAIVEYVQTTRKIKGPAFKDNKVKMRAVLKKANNQWKIYQTTPQKIKYLN